MAKVNVKFVDSLKGYISLVERLRVKQKIQLWYRGCGKASYDLKPSLYRHQQSRMIEDILVLEKDLIARFRQRSIPFHSRVLTDPWEWLFLMQHYGVPTRLLDWSESPLMALFFAVTSARHTLGLRGRPVFNMTALDDASESRALARAASRHPSAASLRGSSRRLKPAARRDFAHLALSY
jgi:hypothetical protein